MASARAPGADVFEVQTSHVSGELSIRGVWAEESAVAAGLPRVVALGCNAAGCQLLGSAANDTSLRVLPEPELPVGARVRRLVAAAGRLCAYGAGLFCIEESTWVSQLPAPAERELLAVTLNTPTAAVTQNGTLLVETDSGWVSRSTPINAPLSIESSDGVLSLLGTEGQWFVASLNPSAESLCEQTPALRLAVPRASPFGQPWRVLDVAGVVYEQLFPSYAWCRLASAVALPLLDVSRVQCGDATNILTISERAFFSLLGPVDCFIR